MEHRDAIRDISEIASKEQSFERLINKMKSDWKDIKFEMVRFRDSEYHILKNLDPVFDKLDEVLSNKYNGFNLFNKWNYFCFQDICKVMAIISSPYIKFLENEVQGWRLQLIRA